MKEVCSVRKVNVRPVILMIGVCILSGMQSINADNVTIKIRDSQVSIEDSFIRQYQENPDASAPQDESPSDMNIGVYASRLSTGEDASYLYSTGYGGGAEFTLSSSRFLFQLDTEVYTAESNNIWSDTYTILSASGGVGLTLFQLGESEISSTLRYGLIAHWNETQWYFNQKGEAGLRLTHQLSDTLRPFIEANVLLMFASPASAVLYNAAVGIQYTI